jgi:hypothetical protein
MKSRCDIPSSTRFDRYGARGITYEPRWAVFENFLADMGPKPPGLTLERRNNNLGYSKENCYWATWDQQALNKEPKTPQERRAIALKIWRTRHARMGRNA